MRYLRKILQSKPKIKAIRLPREMDERVILESYWPNFQILFPELTESQFRKYIGEDFFGGWEEAGHYHAGGRRELKMLFATIRTCKPKSILEIGTYDGRSTDHILLAASLNAEEGHPCKVTTVDISDYLKGRPLFNYPVNIVHSPSLSHLQTATDYDFIMQDGDHTPSYVHQELERFSELPNLKTVWSHDYFLRGELAPVFTADRHKNLFQNKAQFKEEAYSAGFQIGLV